jgi:hypothetical protein
MVKWTKENPFGAHLLNLLITLIAIALLGVFLVAKDNSREYKIDKLVRDSNLIKETVLSITKDTTINE